MALFADPEYGASIERGPYAFTGVADSEVIACAGVVMEWAGRGMCWAIVGENAGPHFRAVHRAVSGFLAQTNIRRLEMVVKKGFPEAHRWARMLGFKMEGCMHAYSPAGDDYYLYAKVRYD